jgi:hypothetical protein
MEMFLFFVHTLLNYMCDQIEPHRKSKKAVPFRLRPWYFANFERRVDYRREGRSFCDWVIADLRDIFPFFYGDKFFDILGSMIVDSTNTDAGQAKCRHLDDAIETLISSEENMEKFEDFIAMRFRHAKEELFQEKK